MQTMFKYKRGSTTKFKLIAEVKMVIPTINMVDVNVFTWNKIGEKHVFKNWEPRKNTSVVGWEVEKKSKR